MSCPAWLAPLRTSARTLARHRVDLSGLDALVRSAGVPSSLGVVDGIGVVTILESLLLPPRPVSRMLRLVADDCLWTGARELEDLSVQLATSSVVFGLVAALSGTSGAIGTALGGPSGVPGLTLGGAFLLLASLGGALSIIARFAASGMPPPPAVVDAASTSARKLAAGSDTAVMLIDVASSSEARAAARTSTTGPTTMMTILGDISPLSVLPPRSRWREAYIASIQATASYADQEGIRADLAVALQKQLRADIAAVTTWVRTRLNPAAGTAVLSYLGETARALESWRATLSPISDVELVRLLGGTSLALIAKERAQARPRPPVDDVAGDSGGLILGALGFLGLLATLK